MIKIKLKQFFILFIFLFSLKIKAQNNEGGIYMLQFKIDNDLIEEFKVEFPEKKFFTSFSEIVQFSDEVLDSIKFVSESFLSKKLNSDVKCIYKYTKRGKKITSVGVLGELDGMPVNTFKNTIQSYNKKYYISIVANFQAGGYSIDFGRGKRSKIKPKLTLVVNVFDIDKNLIFKNKFVEKNFEKLRSYSGSYEGVRGNTVVTASETLRDVDFFSMYKSTLDKLLK
tara:strand:+ start:1929 stop:2606 length:678 start_codon:yes stop_codon:yes gene_type:complete